MLAEYRHWPGIVPLGPSISFTFRESRIHGLVHHDLNRVPGRLFQFLLPDESFVIRDLSNSCLKGTLLGLDELHLPHGPRLPSLIWSTSD